MISATGRPERERRLASVASWSRNRRRFRETCQRVRNGLALRDRVLTCILDRDGRLRRQALCSPALELTEAAERRIEERDRLPAARARERQPEWLRQRRSVADRRHLGLAFEEHAADRASGLDDRLENHREQGAPVVGRGQSAADEVNRLGLLALSALTNAAAEDRHQRLGEQHQCEQGGDRRQRDVPVSLLRGGHEVGRGQHSDETARSGRQHRCASAIGVRPQLDRPGLATADVDPGIAAERPRCHTTVPLHEQHRAGSPADSREQRSVEGDEDADPTDLAPLSSDHGDRRLDRALRRTADERSAGRGDHEPRGLLGDGGE